jgi:hypothetical protein
MLSNDHNESSSESEDDANTTESLGATFIKVLVNLLAPHIKETSKQIKSFIDAGGTIDDLESVLESPEMESFSADGSQLPYPAADIRRTYDIAARAGVPFSSMVAGHANIIKSLGNSSPTWKAVAQATDMKDTDNDTRHIIQSILRAQEPSSRAGSSDDSGSNDTGDDHSFEAGSYDSADIGESTSVRTGPQHGDTSEHSVGEHLQIDRLHGEDSGDHGDTGPEAELEEPSGNRHNDGSYSETGVGSADQNEGDGIARNLQGADEGEEPLPGDVGRELPSQGESDSSNQSDSERGQETSPIDPQRGNDDTSAGGVDPNAERKEGEEKQTSGHDNTFFDRLGFEPKLAPNHEIELLADSPAEDADVETVAVTITTLKESYPDKIKQIDALLLTGFSPEQIASQLGAHYD